MQCTLHVCKSVEVHESWMLFSSCSPESKYFVAGWARLNTVSVSLTARFAQQTRVKVVCFPSTYPYLRNRIKTRQKTRITSVVKFNSLNFWVTIVINVKLFTRAPMYLYDINHSMSCLVASLSLALTLSLCLYLCLGLLFRECFLNDYAFVFDVVLVFVFWVRSCLLITLINQIAQWSKVSWPLFEGVF